MTARLRVCTDQTPSNTAEKLLNHQLVAHYSFDTNNTLDDSGNGYHMVNNGATFVGGRVGQAASFVSTSMSAVVPSIPRDQTICMRLRPNNFATRQNPYDKAFGGE